MSRGCFIQRHPGRLRILKWAPAMPIRRFPAVGRHYFSNPFSSVNHTEVNTLDKLAIGGK
jgi:hypothetical protein